MRDRPIGRREALRITAVVGLSTAFGGSVGRELVRQSGLRRVSETRTRMGTLVTLTAVHPEAVAARAMIAAGFAEMERLERVLSRHRPEATLARLNAAGSLASPPPELTEVLGAALRLADETRGAFDPTVLPVVQLWERAFEQHERQPSPGEVAEALRRVDYRAVQLSEGGIVIRPSGATLTLDGIAKGFIVDRTVAVLTAAGADRVLVDAGGDIASAGAGSSSRPWTVAVQDPETVEGAAWLVRLGGDCVATSMDDRARFAVDRRYRHLVDPRPGGGPDDIRAVTVIAPTAMEADGLSTAAMILGCEEGLAFLERRSGVEGLIVTASGARLRTRGFGGRLA